MNNVIIDKPYVFVPPYDGWFWPKFLQLFVRRRLRRMFELRKLNAADLITFASRGLRDTVS